MKNRLIYALLAGILIANCTQSSDTQVSPYKNPLVQALTTGNTKLFSLMLTNYDGNENDVQDCLMALAEEEQIADQYIAQFQELLAKNPPITPIFIKKLISHGNFNALAAVIKTTQQYNQLCAEELGKKLDMRNIVPAQNCITALVELRTHIPDTIIVVLCNAHLNSRNEYAQATLFTIINNKLCDPLFMAQLLLSYEKNPQACHNLLSQLCNNNPEIFTYQNWKKFSPLVYIATKDSGHHAPYIKQLLICNKALLYSVNEKDRTVLEQISGHPQQEIKNNFILELIAHGYPLNNEKPDTTQALTQPLVEMLKSLKLYENHAKPFKCTADFTANIYNKHMKLDILATRALNSNDRTLMNAIYEKCQQHSSFAVIIPCLLKTPTHMSLFTGLSDYSKLKQLIDMFVNYLNMSAELSEKEVTRAKTICQFIRHLTKLDYMLAKKYPSDIAFEWID